MTPETFAEALVPPSHPRRVLVAEDDEDIRAAVTTWLDLFGYEVIATATGAEFVERLEPWLLFQEEPPCDAIVTDVRMPGFDGLSVVEGLRDLGWTRPIVVISAFADTAMRARLRSLTGIHFLEKPLDPNDLQSALQDRSTGTQR